jgi:hypothetical protein
MFKVESELPLTLASQNTKRLLYGELLYAELLFAERPSAELLASLFSTAAIRNPVLARKYFDQLLR